MFSDTFNPIGNAGFGLQSITPSVVDPLPPWLRIRTSLASRSTARILNSLNPQTGNARAKDVATFYGSGISSALNWITGGSEFRPGMLSPSPDAIDYLIGQATEASGAKSIRSFKQADQFDRRGLVVQSAVGSVDSSATRKDRADSRKAP